MQIQKLPDVRASSYVYLQALGQAIILSNKETARENFPYKHMDRVKKVLKGNESPKSSVVLIDEVDKAPRDFANDLLNELDKYEFFVKEDREQTESYKKGKNNIFVILTSNSEKSLPDAFLRRCIFYHLEFPSNKQLLQIVKTQLSLDNDLEQNTPDEQLMKYIEFFGNVRNKNQDKKPATAELISWMHYLRSHILNDKGVRDIDPDILIASLEHSCKDTGDPQAPERNGDPKMKDTDLLRWTTTLVRTLYDNKFPVRVGDATNIAWVIRQYTSRVPTPDLANAEDRKYLEELICPTVSETLLHQKLFHGIFEDVYKATFPPVDISQKEQPGSSGIKHPKSEDIAFKRKRLRTLAALSVFILIVLLLVFFASRQDVKPPVDVSKQQPDTTILAPQDTSVKKA